MSRAESSKQRPTFTGGLMVAAIAAIALPGCVLLIAPMLGFWSALSAYLMVTAVLYALWLAPGRSERVVTLAFAGLAAGSFLVFVSSDSPGVVRDAAIVAALIVAVSRSGLQYGARPLRAVVLELALSGGGLLLAALLAGSSLLEMAAALWGYLLVQSLFLLAPGVFSARNEREAGDPFDLASARIERLFEEG